MISLLIPLSSPVTLRMPNWTFFPFGELQEIVSHYVISKSGNYCLGKVIHWIFLNLTFLCRVVGSQWSAEALEMVQIRGKNLLLKI